MADTKISALTAASLPLAGTEVLPIVQGGVTVKVASDNLTVKNIRSTATSGILQVTGPAAASTRVMTVPDANFTAARTDAAQTFTGTQTFSNVIQARSSIDMQVSGVNKWQIAFGDNDWYLANADFSKYAQLSPQAFTGWTFASDRRIKKNIKDLEYGLNTVMALQPREFDYISNNLHDIGFIAQELKAVIPEAVSGEEVEYVESDTPQQRAGKTMGITKDALIPVLVKAIQELKSEFDAYKASHP